MRIGRKAPMNFGLSLLATLAQCAALAQAPARDLRIEPLSRRTALVLGNDAYPKWPLRNSVNDARDMAAALSQVGFSADLVLDADLRTLERAVDRFVAGIRPGDIALFFYAGHGVQLFGDNYLVPVDFDAKDEADAKYASYAASRIQDRMENAGARLNVLVLDACRNNPFRTSRSTGGGLAAMGSGRGTLIAFATSPGKTASDNPSGRNGLFTYHLISALREPGLSLEVLFARVRERVYETSSQEQLPWTVSSVIGTFVLNIGPHASIPPDRGTLVRQPSHAVQTLLASVPDSAGMSGPAPELLRLAGGSDPWQVLGLGRQRQSEPIRRNAGLLERGQSPPASPVGWLRAGAMIRVRTDRTLSSDTDAPASAFTVTLDGPLMDDNGVVAPKGSKAEGRVVFADTGGRVQGRARLSVHLTRLEVTGGRWVDVATGAITYEASAATANDAVKLARFSAMGAAIGSLARGGQGAKIGAVAGAAAGAGLVMATKGAPVVIPVETVLEFSLLAPVAVARF